MTTVIIKWNDKTIKKTYSNVHRIECLHEYGTDSFLLKRSEKKKTKKKLNKCALVSVYAAVGRTFCKQISLGMERHAMISH